MAFKDFISLIIAFFSLLIAIGSLLIAVGSIIYTVWCNINETRKNSEILNNSLRLDFSKRYQDLMVSMPDTRKFSEKYACLYFDLCSEEYRLWAQNKNMIDESTWHLWKEGMTDILSDHEELREYWHQKRKYYGTLLKNETKSFQTYFDELVSSVSDNEIV